MRLKAIIPFIIATALLGLALAPLSLAADPEIVPLGPNQSQVRDAYRALFNHLSDGGRAHWAQQPFTHNGTPYAAGDIVAPVGLPTGSFASVTAAGPVAATPALALDGSSTRVAVFRSTVVGSYGDVAWELADVRQTLDSYLWGSLSYDILDETDLATTDLSQYALLILPAVRVGNEPDVVAKLDQAALNNLADFTNAGGFVYAQANGAVIAEAAGLIPAGTVEIGNPLLLTPGAVNNAGKLAVLDPASPLTFSWLTDTLYLLIDPTFEAGPLDVVAEFTNLDGPNQPAILTDQVGLGRVILVAGHPTAATRRNQLPLFINSILWALGRPAELSGDAVQTYNPTLDPHLLPAHEPGTPVKASLTLANVWNATLNNVVITETVAAGFEILPATVSPAANIIAQTNPTQTLLVWNLGQLPPGEVSLTYQAQTGPTRLAKGQLTFATGQASFDLQGQKQMINHTPFKLTSRMAARLQLDRDIELDRQFYLPTEGLYLDVTVPIENKEETLASQVVITDVVLLIAPIVNLDDQETILDLNSGETIWIRNEPFFYDEPGAPYHPATGYQPGDTLTLADWDGAYAEFDVPFGTHLCGIIKPSEMGILGTGNCITIPLSYTHIVTITSDHKLLLPVKVLTWNLGGWPGYHYEEPGLRYGIHSRELFSRTVTFAGDPGIVPDQLVVQGQGGSIYTHLGDHPIFYRDHVVSGLVYIPVAPVQPLVSYQDIWSRTHTTTLRSTFYDVFSWASCGSCGPGTSDRHALLNVTFGMKADLDGDGQRDEDVLIYPSQSSGVDLDIVIKDKSLQKPIPSDQMVIDMGMFKGLGVNIKPRFGSWQHSWSSTDPGTRLLDIEKNSPAYDHLIFQSQVPGGTAEQITLHAVIASYDDVVTEGLLKLHDGARFTYRQQAAGPSRYEVYDTHVQGVLGEAPQLTLTKRGTPVEVSTYGDTIYYVLTIDDQRDPRQLRRNGPGDPFLQSFGFGETAATTYVGGRADKRILHSVVTVSDTTRLRVELNNNSSTIWTGVNVIPQPPAGISISPSSTDNLPPVFHDIFCLNIQTIPEAGRGVYYFDVRVEPDYAGPRGRVVEIPIIVSGNGLPAKFKVPPARLGIEDESGRVYHTYGPAQSLVLTDSLPSYVNLTGAVIATKPEVEALTGAIDDNTRASTFAGLTETIGYSVDNNHIATFDLPGDALDRLYNPVGDHQLFVVARGIISPAKAGPNWANYGAQLSYRDQVGLTWQESSQGLEVEAHGAVLRVNYACREVITGVTRSLMNLADDSEPNPCILYVGQSHLVKMQVTVYNDGDYPAENVTTMLSLSSGVTVLTTPLETRDVTSQTVVWSSGNLAPGGSTTFEMSIFVSLDSDGVIEAAGVQPLVQIVQRTDGEFFDQYSGRTIRAKLADDFNLAVGKVSRTYLTYLPTIFEGYSQPPDLIVKKLQVNDNGVAVVVQNIGAGPVTDAFWVDVYLDPSQPPVYNQPWPDVASEGLVWGVTQAILPGDELTLTIDDAFYAPERSRFSGLIPAETPVWAQVDSINLNSGYGGVPESNESNNVSGPVLPTDIAQNATTSVATSAPPKSLPLR